jgi:hypothetical protein
MKSETHENDNKEPFNLNNDHLIEKIKQKKMSKDKWYTKFKGIFYCLMGCVLIAVSSILIKKSRLFSGFEQAAV